MPPRRRIPRRPLPPPIVMPPPPQGGRADSVKCEAMITHRAKTGNIIMPVKAPVVAPWVRIRFGPNDSDWWVTVGNESCPSDDNHAIISSFQYGCSGGNSNGSDGISVEITDEVGGAFSEYMLKRMPGNRDEGKPATNCTMEFQFGWTTIDCMGKAICIPSRKRKCYPLKVDVAFQGGGVIKFTINACNPTEVIAEGENSKNNVYKGMPIKKAIRQMFNEQKMDAMFLTSLENSPNCGAGGTCCEPAMMDSIAACPPRTYKEWKFPEDDGGCDGQISNWDTNNRDPVSAAMAWLQNKMTQNKPPRGFVVGTCNLKSLPKPTIVFWESPLPDCTGESKMYNIGTFIVNGGPCSPVLEFKPQLTWHVANINKGGTAASPTTGQGVGVDAKTFPEITCNVTGKGTPQINQVTQHTASQHPSNASQVTAQALAANARAMPPMEPIKADLVVQGIPALDDPMALCAGVECAIVVIDPFILDKSGLAKGSCPDWLADPPVNEFLSNRHWLINGVSHQIKEGSFTTTLSVWLAVPGVLLNSDAPLGGSPGPTMLSATQ